FNRGITLDARAKIAAAYREEFNISSPAPTGFNGVPVVNNLNSWFIRFERERKPDQVSNLWDLAEAAVSYAKDPTEEAKEVLVSTFDACAGGQTRQLTMGLFWIRPTSLPPFDGTNAAYIASVYPELARMLTLESKITGEAFLANTEDIAKWVGTDGHPESLPEPSYKAHHGAPIGPRQLTMGLFWIRPTSLPPFDGTNAVYIAAVYPELARMLTLKSKITGEEFLANTEAIASWVGTDGHPESLPELSYQAYLGSRAELETTVPQTEDDDAPLELDDSYTFESIMEDGAFFSSAELESILSTLTRKRNIILQGPPGTGKTWLGRRLGWALCGRKSNTLVSVVQFHPSFSYEDFVRGWRPSSAGKLELTDGPF